MKSVRESIMNGAISEHIELQTNQYTDYLANLYLLFYDYLVNFTVINWPEY